jgi:uncharacterized protein
MDMIIKYNMNRAQTPKHFPEKREKMKELIESAFPRDSALRERLLALDALYAALAARQAGFQATGLYRCPPGCGRCSATFEPDVLHVEAVLVDLYAQAHGLPTDAPPAGPTPRCPLYREDSNRHCPVYPARPLVCRLFGFSSLPEKTGDLVYTPCEHMEGPGRGGRRLPALGLSADALPPSMIDFSTGLQALAPGEETHRAPLRDALRAAAAQIGLYRAMLQGEG